MLYGGSVRAGYGALVSRFTEPTAANVESPCSQKAALPDESWIGLLDSLCWVDCGDRMLEYDLATITAYQHHGEVVEPPDLGLQLYAVDEKHICIKLVFPKMREECILHRCCRLCVHACNPSERPCGTPLCMAQPHRHDLNQDTQHVWENA